MNLNECWGVSFTRVCATSNRNLGVGKNGEHNPPVFFIPSSTVVSGSCSPNWLAANKNSQPLKGMRPESYYLYTTYIQIFQNVVLHRITRYRDSYIERWGRKVRFWDRTCGKEGIATGGTEALLYETEREILWSKHSWSRNPSWGVWLQVRAISTDVSVNSVYKMAMNGR